MSKIQIAVENSGRLVFRLGFVSLVSYLIFHIDILAIASSVLLSAYFTSRLLSQLSLRGLHIQISTKQLRTRCDEPIQATLSFTNQNRFIPVFYLIVSVREKDSLRIQVFQHQGFIPAKSTLEVAISTNLATRGLRQLEAFAPRSKFPYALHEATANLQSLSSEIIVWPKPATLDVDSLFDDPPSPKFQTVGEQSRHAQQNEPSRIRDYQPGDPKPSINWKLSAKLDKLTIIEPRFERLERYELFLDPSIKLWPSVFLFERMLSLVSSLVSELSRRHLLQGISIDGLLFPLTNNRELTRFFDALAVIRPTNHPPIDLPPARRNILKIVPAPDSSITLVTYTTKPILAPSR